MDKKQSPFKESIFKEWRGRHDGLCPYGTARKPAPQDEEAWLRGRAEALRYVEFLLGYLDPHTIIERIHEDRRTVALRLEILREGR